MKRNEILQIISDGIRKGVQINLVREFEVFDSRVLYEKVEIVEVEVAENVNKKSLTSIIQQESNHESQRLVVSERVWARDKLIVFGGGHVGQAVSLIAAFLGFHVEVVDDRIDILIRSRFPDPRIKLSVVNLERGLGGLCIDSETSVVIVTRGHQHDECCLRWILENAVRYIGMIGSKRRVYSIFSKLEEDGFTKADTRRVHAPVGLGIGATSPQEIGVAIMAEVIAHREGYCMRESCRVERG
jgi:xanthine dehydrogenase accessory factor